MSTVREHPFETNNGVVTSCSPLTTVWPLFQACSKDYILEEDGWTDPFGPTATVRPASSLFAFLPDCSGRTGPGFQCLPEEVVAS